MTITYPAHPGTQTSFAYDGLSRRTAITSIAGVTTSYLWCGSRICQARNAGGGTTREYYAEGEYVPGAPAQTLYYGPDQLGTVRRVFASTPSAPAYAYDPYGQPLQATAPVTDFTYAGMFANADSGLLLTRYRAYDPVAGRWLSRDPLGERTDPVGNLYRYVQGNPVVLIDPLGVDTIQWGFTGSATFYASLSVSFGVISDTYGNTGVYGTVGWGAGSSPGLYGGVGGALSNAKTICDVAGPFHELGGAGGAGPGVNDNYFWGGSPNGPVQGLGGSGGTAVGAGAFSQTTYTYVIPLLQW